MAKAILAEDHRQTTREELKRAILQRTTRGVLTFNTGKVHQIDEDLWAVPSTRGGFYQVDLGDEVCPCEDYTFFGSERGVACRHIYAAAIAKEKRRLWLWRAARAIAPVFEDVGDDAPDL